MKKDTTFIDIPAADQTHLEQHHASKTVPVMAKELKRANATVYAWMKQLGLPPKARTIGRSHPFRVQNRGLEKIRENYQTGNEGRRGGRDYEQ